MSKSVKFMAIETVLDISMADAILQMHLSYLGRYRTNCGLHEQKEIGNQFSFVNLYDSLVMFYMNRAKLWTRKNN